MTAPGEIHLAETSPGSWEMPRRVAGAIHPDLLDEESANDFEVRREAFFDSLAGPIKPIWQPAHWAWFVMWVWGFIPLIGCALLYLTTGTLSKP